MKTADVLDTVFYPTNKKQRNRFQTIKYRWLMLFGLSCVSVFLFGIIGIFINVISLLGFSKNKFIDLVGILLFILILPASFFSAHCLDKIDETDKAIKMERLKNKGFN